MTVTIRLAEGRATARRFGIVHRDVLLNLSRARPQVLEHYSAPVCREPLDALSE